MNHRLRNVYHLLFTLPYWRSVNRIRVFYSQFISRGDLVFDVGATARKSFPLKGQANELACCHLVDSQLLLGQVSTRQGYGDVLVRAHS